MFSLFSAARPAFHHPKSGLKAALGMPYSSAFRSVSPNNRIATLSGGDRGRKAVGLLQSPSSHNAVRASSSAMGLRVYPEDAVADHFTQAWRWSAGFDGPSSLHAVAPVLARRRAAASKAAAATSGRSHERRVQRFGGVGFVIAPSRATTGSSADLIPVLCTRESGVQQSCRRLTGTAVRWNLRIVMPTSQRSCCKITPGQPPSRLSYIATVPGPIHVAVIHWRRRALSWLASMAYGQQPGVGYWGPAASRVLQPPISPLRPVMPGFNFKLQTIKHCRSASTSGRQRLRLRRFSGGFPANDLAWQLARKRAACCAAFAFSRLV